MQSFLVRDFSAEYATLALPYRLRNFSTLVVMDADIMFICEDVFGFICRLRTARRKKGVTANSKHKTIDKSYYAWSQTCSPR